MCGAISSEINFIFRYEEDRLKQIEVKEMIFLRDLHFGFLPDEWEEEFKDCFEKIAKVFFSKVLLLLWIQCGSKDRIFEI